MPTDGGGDIDGGGTDEDDNDDKGNENKEGDVRLGPKSKGVDREWNRAGMTLNIIDVEEVMEEYRVSYVSFFCSFRGLAAKTLDSTYRTATDIESSGESWKTVRAGSMLYNVLFEVVLLSFACFTSFLSLLLV